MLRYGVQVLEKGPATPLATEHYSDPKVLRDALDFIAANAPDSADFGNRNVYVGEFGMPENVYSLVGATHASPVQVRGFWLIRPNGTKAWTWDYFHGLFTAARTDLIVGN